MILNERHIAGNCYDEGMKVKEKILIRTYRKNERNYVFGKRAK